MRYSNGRAFRRALDDRLRTKSQQGVPLVRLRKMVAFDRFLARLVKETSDRWILKGGFGLQLRIGDRARTTKDIDLLAMAPRQEIRTLLQTAGALDLGDWFAFQVGAQAALPPDPAGGMRFPVQALLDGRTFEHFHVDVGVGDPLVLPVEHVETPPLLEFAGIPPTSVPCYPIVQQIAEKVHAFTRIHPSGASSRVKDLVDILLMAALQEMDAGDLYRALEATFEARAGCDLPAAMPSPPRTWSGPYAPMAREVGLDYDTLDSAGEALQRFLNPVLSRQTRGNWDPDSWSWR